MDNTYLVLRKKQKEFAATSINRKPNPGSLESRTVMSETEIAVEREVLSNPSHLDLLKNDPSVLGIARPMPIKPILPASSVCSTSAIDGSASWGIGHVNALNSPFDGSGVTIGVIDSGIDAAHEAFRGMDLIRRDFTSTGLDDRTGHGTHCAGTIFGRDVNGIRIGIAKGVTRAVIGKVINPGFDCDSGDLSKAILWAHEEGAEIISMSLGIDFPGLVTWLVNVEGYSISNATSIALEAYVSNIRLFESLGQLLSSRSQFSHSSVILAASGNESQHDASPPVSINAAPPAASQGIIAVGALGRTPMGLAVAPFSNFGPSISAPGVDILSACANGGTSVLSGTSMATPHVAGVASLWVQKIRQNLRANEIISHDILNARIIGSGTYSSLATGAFQGQVGSGIVQAPMG